MENLKLFFHGFILELILHQSPLKPLIFYHYQYMDPCSLILSFITIAYGLPKGLFFLLGTIFQQYCYSIILISYLFPLNISSPFDRWEIKALQIFLSMFYLFFLLKMYPPSSYTDKNNFYKNFLYLTCAILFLVLFLFPLMKLFAGLCLKYNTRLAWIIGYCCILMALPIKGLFVCNWSIIIRYIFPILPRVFRIRKNYIIKVLLALILIINSSVLLASIINN